MDSARMAPLRARNKEALRLSRGSHRRFLQAGRTRNYSGAAGSDERVPPDHLGEDRTNGNPHLQRRARPYERRNQRTHQAGHHSSGDGRRDGLHARGLYSSPSERELTCSCTSTSTVIIKDILETKLFDFTAETNGPWTLDAYRPK